MVVFKKKTYDRAGIRKKGKEYDKKKHFATGGLALGHTGPFNVIGKAYDSVDKAAQLHDIAYSQLGPEAYTHFNQADQDYIDDLEKETGIRKQIGSNFFKLKKLLAPTMKLEDPSSYELMKLMEEEAKRKQSSETIYVSKRPNDMKGERKDHVVVPYVGDVAMNDTTFTSSNVESGSPASTMDQTGLANPGNLPPLTINSGANADNLNNSSETKIFKFKNTYKVLLDNTADITINIDNCYGWVDQSNNLESPPNFDDIQIPIYDHNGQQEAYTETDSNKKNWGNYTLYTKLPWKIIPTLKKENYITPGQWNEMLSEGWDASREVGKRVRINGLYQLHNYEQASLSEIQNQTNPYIEFCSPKGQFFKHEHYRINNIPDNFNPNPKNQANQTPIVMNVLPAFKPNIQDIEALGIPSNATGLDQVKYDNGLLNYYYPVFSAKANTMAVDRLDRQGYLNLSIEYSGDWYPDFTATQTIHMTDLIDDYVHSVPTENQFVYMYDYLSYVRPGSFCLFPELSSGLASPWPTNGLADYRTCAIGHIDYLKGISKSDLEEYQHASPYENTPPLLCRIPNHPNSGSQLIKNKCYFYITYEIEIECKRYKRESNVTFNSNPPTWSTALCSYALTGLYPKEVNKVAGGITTVTPFVNHGITINYSNVYLGRYYPVYKLYNNPTTDDLLEKNKFKQFTWLNDSCMIAKQNQRKKRKYNSVVDNEYQVKTLTWNNVKKESYGEIYTRDSLTSNLNTLSDNQGFQPKFQ